MSDYLPPEVVTEILSRLPVKSLLKFRCVCKSWCSQIESPNFARIHLNQTKTSKYHQKLLLTRYMSWDSPIEKYSLRVDNSDFDEYETFVCPFKPNRAHFRVVGVSNGLVCLSDDCFKYTYTYIIWNPAIRRFLELPKPSVNYTDYGPFMTALGFGFDVQRNDCKLVRLTYLQRPTSERSMFYLTPKVEVFSFSSGSWKRIKRGVPSCGIVEHTWSQVFLNGSLHWVAYKDDTVNLRNVVLSFNMADEKFGILEFPEPWADMLPIQFSVELHADSLALIACNVPIDGNMFAVYVMNEYGVVESWSKLFRVEIKEVIRTVLGFKEDREMLVVTQDDEIAAFEPNCKRTKKLGIRGYKGSLYAAAYEESLALLNGEFASQLKSYESPVASDDSSDEDDKVDGEFFVNRVTMRYLFAASSLPGFKPPFAFGTAYL